MKKSGMTACLFFCLLCFSLEVPGAQQRFAGKLIGKPDLAVSLVCRTGDFFPGKDLVQNLQVTVFNKGNKPSPGCSLDLLLSPLHQKVSAAVGRHRRLSSMKVSPLPAGGSVTVAFPGPVRIPEDVIQDDYSLIAHVDPGNTVTEADETNNVARVGVRILALITRAYPFEQGWAGCECKLGLEILGKGFNSQMNYTIHLGDATVQLKDCTPGYIIGCPPFAALPIAPNLPCYLTLGSKKVSNKVAAEWGVGTYAVDPAAGPPGTFFRIRCCNAKSQGSKALFFVTYPKGPKRYPVTVKSWSDKLITGIVPKVPAGKYVVMISEGGIDLAPYALTYIVL